jgi:hypothetical protein
VSGEIDRVRRLVRWDDDTGMSGFPIVDESRQQEVITVALVGRQ